MGRSYFSSSFTWQGVFFSNHHFQHPREGTFQALVLFFFTFPSGGKMLGLRWECMAIGNTGQVQLAVVCITCFMANRRGFCVGLGLTHWKLSAREEFAFSPRVTWAQSQRSRWPCSRPFLWWISVQWELMCQRRCSGCLLGARCGCNCLVSCLPQS